MWDVGLRIGDFVIADWGLLMWDGGCGIADVGLRTVDMGWQMWDGRCGMADVGCGIADWGCGIADFGLGIALA
jgi:hypothetical protein